VYAAKTAGICLLLGGIVLALLQAGCEQPKPAIETWERTYGGDTTDVGRSVRQTSDGGYIIAGDTRSQGSGYSDAWLIKTDASGNEVRSKTFGGPKGDLGLSGQQTSDGGYIIAGSTQSYAIDTSSNDMWLVKTDPNGDVSWSRTFSPQGGPSGACSVQQTRDGGYIITGWTEPNSGQDNFDVGLIKTDPTGNTMWRLTFGGPDEEWGSSVEQTADGGYVVTGSTTSSGAGFEDVWLFKTD